MTSRSDPGRLVTARARRPGCRQPRWWLAVITFVVGVAVGVVTVGLLSSGVPNFPTASEPSATAPPTSAGSSSAGGSAGASAEVNAACLRVISEAQELYDILTGVGPAAADVDLQRLDDIVRQLQPIQPRLQRDLEDCNVDTRLGGSSGTSSPSPVPTAPETSATATPTR